MRLWLTQNWLILALLVGGAGWAANIQSTKVDRQVVEEKHEEIVEQQKEELDKISKSISAIQVDLAYIRGAIDAQDKARSEVP
jgi:hypothetical protein